MNTMHQSLNVIISTSHKIWQFIKCTLFFCGYITNFSKQIHVISGPRKSYDLSSNRDITLRNNESARCQARCEYTSGALSLCILVCKDVSFQTSWQQLRCTWSNKQWSKCNLTAIPRSTLVQVMAWCRQATSHYLSQCWKVLLMW